MSSAAQPWTTVDERARLAIAPTAPRSRASIGRRDMRGYRAALAIADGAVITLAVAGALIGRFGAPAPEIAVIGTAVGYGVIATALAAAWFVGLTLSRSRDTKIVGSGALEYRRVVSATAMVFGLAAIVLLVAKVDIARGFFLVAFPLGLVGLLASRWLARRVLLVLRRAGRCSSATVIVGRADDVRQTLVTLGRSPGSAYRAVGVVLSDPADRVDDPAARWSVPVLGTTSDAREIGDLIRRDAIDTVIVAGQPGGGGDFIRMIGWELERTDAELMIASRLTDVAGPRIHFRPADGLPLMHVELPSYEGAKHVAKRALDVAVAGIALLVLAPLLLFIAVAIRRHDGGPVLFRQQRVGRNGELFPMYKFRSMVTDAEAKLAELRARDEGNGVLFKMRDDPRVTPPGRVLRRFSLDELPQLWNVLRGDMSLVGPRPPLGTEVDTYERHVLRRLYIKPGLTGMWQINGRSDLSWEDSVRLDLYYVENWSLTGDLVILWRTARVVLQSRGAY